MINLSTPNFAIIIDRLDSLSPRDRVEFFRDCTPDKFLLWWFYYFSDDFITPLAPFHYDWIESLVS
jgi:hypothetical protein